MEWSAIHLLHKRGTSQRQIAQELGYSRVTVARVLAEPPERPPTRRRHRSITDPYREHIRVARGRPHRRPDAGAGAP